MREKDVYGEVLVDVYNLESKVAEWPRIVVGERLFNKLHDAEKEPFENFEWAIGIAEECRSMLTRDKDGTIMIDVLGAWMDGHRSSRRTLTRNKVRDAHRHVRDELRKHENACDKKLIPRYRTLVAYFDQHVPKRKRKTK